MASASMAVSFGLRFSPLNARPSVRVSHSSVGLASCNKANSLKLSSSHNISGYGVAFLQKPSHITTTSQSHTPFTVFAAKGYKMKTHKASAKRFRVTGRGKIVRRRAGKQHLLYKKNAKRRLRLSKMHPVSRSDYDNVIGALPYLKSVSGPGALSTTSSHNNPLDEPSPLGLVLRKSPSLLDLIQMKLSQGSAFTVDGPSNTETSNFMVKTESQDATMPGTNEKLKASNFPASLLKIGRWEYKSRHEGDLVAKCYYAKHKLVWEILEGGLKSKIEIQWSDIMGLKANCPDDGPAILNVVLARRPLFFRETNPQPRKHTLWQATADFTDGEASIRRQHFLQCPNGLLNKHFEKLIQCDSRLNFLSRQPEIVLGSPYFEPRASTFTTLEHASICGLEQAENDNQSLLSTFPDVVSSSASSSLKIEQASPQMVFEPFTVEAPSPSSVMDAHEIEENRSTKVTSKPRNWEQMKVPGLHPSMSMSDLVNHIGHHITEQMASTKIPFVNNGSEEYQAMLDDIAQYLLSDNQLSSASDELSLMSRVDSLYCLLQKEPVQSSQINGVNCVEEPNYKDDVQLNDAVELRDDRNIEDHIKIHPEMKNDVSGSMQASAMSRKDSYGDLLLHLPRIASLPKFLFDISDGDEGQD